MVRQQRYKHEMLVRVRDYGVAHRALFPESSPGAQRFQQVEAAVAALDEHLKGRVVARAEARKVKAATRAAAYDAMKTLALAARRVVRQEPGTNPFRMPERKSLTGIITTARVFLAEAEKRQDKFVEFGLPPAFIGEFRALVDDLQAAVTVRINSKTLRQEARAGIHTALQRGLEAVRDLDPIVAVATRQDPVALAAWQTARRIEGLPSASSGAVKSAAPAGESAPPSSSPTSGSPPDEAPTPVQPELALGRAS